MDNQSHQFEAWSNLFDKESKILSENVAELTGKFNHDVIQEVIEGKINEVLLQKDFHMKSEIENIINDKMKVNAVQYLDISDMQDRIKDLEQIIFDKDNLIEKLNEEKISLEIELEKAEKKYKNMNPVYCARTMMFYPWNIMKKKEMITVECSIKLSKKIEEPDKPVTEQDNKEDKYEDIQLNKKEEITIPVDVLTKLLDELEELKNNKQKEWQFKLLQHNTNIEVFCDSFGKHIDENRCFGKDNATNINICFITTQLLDTVIRKQKDESVTHVLIQCGFNDLKQPNSESHVINTTKAAIELLESKFSRALLLIGEIIPHPNENNMNRRINATNFVIHNQYPGLTSKVRFVQHPTCKKENSLYEVDGIHLNSKLGTPQLIYERFLQSFTRQAAFRTIEMKFMEIGIKTRI